MTRKVEIMRDRISALLLVLFASLPIWGYYQYESNEDGVTITWASDEITGDVQIPSDLWGEKVTRIGTGVFRNRGTIRSVAIPSTVTVIEEGAFEKCTSLERVSGCYDDWIEGGHLKDIGNSAFSGCSMLSEFDFQSSITNIGISAFEGCSQLRLSGSLSAESIGERAFYGCSLVYPGDGFELVLGETIKYIGASAFSASGEGSWGHRIIVPANVIKVDSDNFMLSEIVLLGRTQLASDYSARASSISVNPQYRGYYMGLLGEGIHDYQGMIHQPLSVRIISSKMRKNDPTLMDVEYEVKSVEDAVVDTRVLAYVGGKSFATVIRPESFLEGAQIGDDIKCNVTNSFTWRVSADFDAELETLRIEVLVRRKGSSLLSLDFVTIPATETTPAIRVSVNELRQQDYLTALYWLYADKKEDLIVKNGILYAAGVAVAQDSYLAVISGYEDYLHMYRRTPKSREAAKYIFGLMGFALLEENMDAKTFVSKVLKRPFVSGYDSSTILFNNEQNTSYRQFAYKYLDE